MTLVVRTARLGECNRADALDVTRGTGRGDALAFAPSLAILRPAQTARRRCRQAALGGRIVSARRIEDAAWEVYRPAFIAEMRACYVARRGVWDALLARESVTLCCYCRHGAHCHRYLLAEMLVKLGATYEGELTDD